MPCFVKKKRTKKKEIKFLASTRYYGTIVDFFVVLSKKKEYKKNE